MLPVSRVSGRTFLRRLLHNLSVIWQIRLPFTGVQRLTVWLPRYQLMHQCCGAICSMGALSIHVPCMRSSLGNPNPNGPQRFQGTLACAVPECTIHTPCLILLWLRSFLISGCLSGIWYDFWGPPYVAHHYYQTSMFDVWGLSLVPMSEVFLWRRWSRTGRYMHIFI